MMDLMNNLDNRPQFMHKKKIVYLNKREKY